MKAIYVIGYYLTAEEWINYLNNREEEAEEVAAALKEYAHYTEVSEDPSGDMVFGFCKGVANERKFFEIRDGETYISMAQFRELVDKMSLCFPNLPYKATRAVKEYICCQVEGA